MENAPCLIGQSAAIDLIKQEIDLAARSDAKVLVTGPSGVGKEIVARLIHIESHRRQGPIVTINCAGVPDTLLESELFGHVRGSFTDAHRDRRGWLEQADGGTIFMDEVGEMSLRMQAVLLRFLETGEIQRVGSDRPLARVDVRVIAATNKRLIERIPEGAFREDLYYRLNVIHIEIPPLCERREDIRVLMNHFVEMFGGIHRTPAPELTTDAWAAIHAYDWPGNVRQLKNVAERLVVRCRSKLVTAGDLPPEIAGPRKAVPPVPPTPNALLPAAPDLPQVKELLDRMRAGESFWSVVYEPFVAHDLTRDDVRGIVREGLLRTHGSYRILIALFNMESSDYKRFLSFLRKHECHMPFQGFRTMSSIAGHQAQSKKAV
jgi:DNA-binding NtrC family response regulator